LCVTGVEDVTNGKDVVEELEPVKVDQHSIARTGNGSERVTAEVLLIVRPHAFRQQVCHLPEVETVRVDVHVVHGRVLDVGHAKLLGQLFGELGLADGVATLDGDLKHN